MRKYHDENYNDPQAAAKCAVCGEPIYDGDDCIIVQEGLIHLSCAKRYVMESDYSDDDIVDAFKLERKVWCA